MTTTSKFKIAVIGCGNVGATTAYTLFTSGVSSELVLYDIDVAKAEGIALDFNHSLNFVPYTKLTVAKSVNSIKHADLIIVTAGQKQKKGQTRPDLIKANKQIFDQIIPPLAKNSPKATLLIVTNPVDALTLHAFQISKFSRDKVFGTGTLLDTSRFRFHLSQLTSTSPANIHTYILGEHGDSSFPAISCGQISGIPLSKKIDKNSIKQAFQDTQKAAYRIINDVGFTCYSIAQVCLQISQTIKQNSNKVFPLSTVLEGEYGLKNVSLSIPCRLNQSGIAERIILPLSLGEKNLLKKSAKAITSTLKST